MRQEPEKEQQTKRSPKALAPSLVNAQSILRKAARCGNVTFTQRLLGRCRMHVINTVDVVRVLCTGTLISSAQFDAQNDGWRYQIVGLAEGKKLMIEVLLDANHDFDESPFVSVLTAAWWKGRVRSSRE